ncbi:MAG: hypothetical protein GTN82_14430 [Candidatus Aminicenantes bacterium]|nr:hypothetical protein [Candidatus Aminicenantes bacterium]
MNVTKEQQQHMVANLNKSFELLKTVMELKLAYLKKMYPDKTEAVLIRKIHLDVIEAKERQWKLQKI